MTRQRKIDIGYALGALLLLVLFQFWLSYRPTAQISYSELLDYVAHGQVAEVTISESLIQGQFSQPQEGSEYFIAHRVDPELAEAFAEAGVKVNGATENTWFTALLSWVLPAVVMIGVWSLFFRRLGGSALGGLTAIGKSKAKVYVETATGVTFKDVAGVDEAKAELQEIVSFLKDTEHYGRLGARIPKGILLVGPPGTGKTLLARAVAGEAGVPFFSISGSEFVEMFVGVGAARVRDLFEQARQAAPCIIFIDELDALGRARTPFSGLGGGDEKEQTLNQLLSELDGFDPRVGIVLLAATNRPEILDPALTRAGRFDRQVVLDRPDKPGREAILKVHLARVILAPDVVAADIAGLTPGFTGADLANAVNEAALHATRRGAEAVAMQDFVAAIERIVGGLERRSRVLQPEERRKVAYHEMGHALTAAALPGADVVQKVSIIPRSIGALGFTMQRPTEDRFLMGIEELKDKLAVLVAGRAAEELVFGEVSTGAADDLAKATEVARQMVCRFGMSKDVGQAVLEVEQQAFLGDGVPSGIARRYSDETAREVDLAVRQLIEESYARAKTILQQRFETLREGAELLLARETLTPQEFPAIAPAAETRAAAE